MASTNSTSSRHNKRDWRTPISADELAGDPTMVGHTSLLENVPVEVERSQTSQPKTGPPVSHAPVTRRAVGDASNTSTGRAELTRVESSPLDIERSVSDQPETIPLETGPPVLSRLPVVREARLVQDGHTNGEQRVYDAMWKSARAVDDHRRVLTIGFGKIAQISNLSESNCKPAIAGLLEKLAIDRLPDRNPANLAYGRTYQIYSWSMVLKRRREAGLTHVIKTRGVVFVNPSTGERLTSSQTPPRSKTGWVETGPSVLNPALEELDLQIKSLEEFTQQFPTHMQHDQDLSRLAELKRRREQEAP